MALVGHTPAHFVHLAFLKWTHFDLSIQYVLGCPLPVGGWMALPSTGHTSAHLAHPMQSSVTYLGEVLIFTEYPFSDLVADATSAMSSTSAFGSRTISFARSIAKQTPQFLHSMMPLQVSSLAMPPSDSFLSTRTTFAPMSTRDLAAVNPAGPPPITRTSFIVDLPSMAPARISLFTV